MFSKMAIESSDPERSHPQPWLVLVDTLASREILEKLDTFVAPALTSPRALAAVQAQTFSATANFVVVSTALKAAAGQDSEPFDSIRCCPLHVSFSFRPIEKFARAVQAVVHG